MPVFGRDAFEEVRDALEGDRDELEEREVLVHEDPEREEPARDDDPPKELELRCPPPLWLEE